MSLYFGLQKEPCLLPLPNGKCLEGGTSEVLLFPNIELQAWPFIRSLGELSWVCRMSPGFLPQLQTAPQVTAINSFSMQLWADLGVLKTKLGF